MRRTGRYILNGLSILSLLLCVGTGVLWVRSYWVADRVRIASASADLRYRYDLRLATDSGRLSWRSLTATARMVTLPNGSRRRFPVGQPDESVLYHSGPAGQDDGDFRPLPGGVRVLGVAIGSETGDYPGMGMHQVRRVVVVPLWALSALSAALPTARLWGVRRRREEPSTDRCPACGYDLRATPARCPECGLAPAAAPAGHPLSASPPPASPGRRP